MLNRELEKFLIIVLPLKLIINSLIESFLPFCFLYLTNVLDVCFIFLWIFVSEITLFCGYYKAQSQEPIVLFISYLF
jgi:hypothetical protein